jgi:hypothetical protein
VVPFARFEIFRRVGSGNIEWIETVESLGLVRDRLARLIVEQPGANYFVFDRLRLRFIDVSELESIDEKCD